MSEQPIHLTASGPPSTVMEPATKPTIDALEAAMATDPSRRKKAVAAVAADDPSCVDVWAGLGANADSVIEAYAYYRVGYHRGLDALRRSGWRGSGFVRWVEPTNRGFLRALLGLQRCAAQIGESAEDIRCQEFLFQLDPSGVPGDE